MMYGADSDELERIAKELDGYEAELGQLLLEGVGAVSLVGLSSTLGTVWRGPRSDEFAALWQSRHLLRLHGIRSVLSDASADLNRNADEQRTTSAVTSMRRPGELSPYEKSVIDAFIENTDDLGEDPVAYWNSLDDYEKQILMAHEPDWVLSLKPLGALSPEEIAAAEQAWLRNVGEEFEIVEHSVESFISAEVDVKLVSFGIEGSSTISELRGYDGATKYRVAFAVEGDAAKAGFGLEAGGMVAYEFDTKEEAQAFQQGLVDTLIPSGGEIALGLVPFGGAGLLAANKAGDLKKYADKHSSNRVNARVHGGVHGAFELNGKKVEAEVDAGAGVFYDAESNERGFYVDLAAEAEADISDSIELNGGLSLHGEMVFSENNQPKELVLEFEAELTGKFEADGVMQDLFGENPFEDEIEGDIGARAKATIKLDLTNPRNEALAEAVLNGDPGAIASIAQNSEIVLEAGMLRSATDDIEFGVGEIEWGAEEYQNLKTYGRGPNSSFQEIK